MARILETTPRSIKYYIESLRMAEVPIEGLSGKSGGYFLSKEFWFSTPGLDEAEYSALLLAEEFLKKSNGFIYENEIRTAFSKIKAAQGEIMGNSNFIDRSDIADSRGKTDIAHQNKKLISIIQKAIFDRKRILIHYNNPLKKEKTIRKIDPYNLIFREFSWYVIGFCHLREQVRMFKLMRIKKIECLEENYQIQSGYNMQSYLKDTFTLIKGRESIVEIQFFHPASVWVSEKLWLPTQKIVHLEDDSIIFTAKVDGLKEIKKWVLGFGKLAKVRKPRELIEQIMEEINEVQEHYKP